MTLVTFSGKFLERECVCVYAYGTAALIRNHTDRIILAVDI